MTRYNLALNAYSTSGVGTRSPRSTEYEVFSRITRGLKTADEAKSSNYPRFVEALNENRKLWTLVAGMVAESDNKLAQELRARLFYLAEFTSKHTQDVLQKGSGIAPLLEINALVMNGLRGSGQDA